MHWVTRKSDTAATHTSKPIFEHTDIERRRAVATSLLMTPLDVVKTRLQAQSPTDLRCAGAETPRSRWLSQRVDVSRSMITSANYPKCDLTFLPSARARRRRRAGGRSLAAGGALSAAWSRPALLPRPLGLSSDFRIPDPLDPIH